jgi:glycosyltransferase involved in cell wall biosynthesis
MKTEIKVSVIVPVYNGGSAVGAALSSLFEQDLSGLEIIAVNDASTDGTGSVLDVIASSESRLRVVHQKENGGVHEARAAGLRAASGEWIGFMDADDSVEPNMFSTLYREASESNADIVICSVRTVDENGRNLGIKVKFEDRRLYTEKLLEKYTEFGFGSGVLWNKLYRREVILPWGTQAFRWRQNATEDTLVNIGCFASAQRMVVLPNALYNYKIHAASATQAASVTLNYNRLLRAYAEAVDAYADFGESALRNIDLLYRTQLQGQSYAVADLDDFSEFHESLSEAVHRLAQSRPSAVYAAINPGIANPRYFEQRQSTFQQWCRLSHLILSNGLRKMCRSCGLSNE